MAKLKIVSFDPLINLSKENLNLPGLTIDDTISLIKQVIEFDSTYIVLDQIRVEEALLNPTDNINNYFNRDEIIELANQAYFLGMLTDSDKLLILDDSNLNILNELLSIDNYKKLLQYQLEYIPVIKRYIPTISELQSNGLDDYTIDLINDEFQAIIGSNSNINIIQNIVNNFLYQKYSSTTFTPTVKIEYIYQYPTDFLKILSNDELISLLDRVRYYLDFLTDELVNTLKTLPNSTTKEQLLNLISVNEIKLIVDKEIDIKNGVINALSFKEVQRMYDDIQNSYELSDEHAIRIVYQSILFANQNKNVNYFS